MSNPVYAFVIHICDLGRTTTDVSNGRCSCDGEQFCQTILKYIHDCRSCGTDE